MRSEKSEDGTSLNSMGIGDVFGMSTNVHNKVQWGLRHERKLSNEYMVEKDSILKRSNHRLECSAEEEKKETNSNLDSNLKIHENYT